MRAGLVMTLSRRNGFLVRSVDFNGIGWANPINGSMRNRFGTTSAFFARNS
jgi:hypothetical protein